MSVLDGIRVIDCGFGVAGPIAGMFFADFGAGVVKIEPPEGDPGRATPGFQVWNRGKSSAVIDPASAEDRALLAAWLRNADVWILSSTSTEEFWGVCAEEIRAVNPRLIVLRVPSYLDETPWAGGAEDGALLSAWGGEHWRQASFDGSPVDSVYRHALTVQGVWAASCVVAALVERERSGSGQIVTVSGAQALAAMMVASYTVHADAPDPSTAIGPAGRHPTYGRYRARDGLWLACGGLGNRFETDMLRLIGLGNLLESDRMAGKIANLLAPENISWAQEQVSAVIARRDRQEWLDLLESAGIPCGPVEPAERWLDHPLVRAMGMRTELTTAAGEPLVMAGVPIVLEGAPGRVLRAAPILGEHQAMAVRPPDLVAPGPGARGPRPGPLADVRVLNLGTFVATPYAGTLLAELGASVVKVEAPTGDPFRRSGYSYNRGMRSLAVDLRSPAGQAAFLRAVSDSDAVLDGLRPGVTLKLGIDHDSLALVKPDIITLSLSAYGEGGAYSGKPGVDMVIQGMCGMMTAQGGDDEPVPNTVAVIDVTAAHLSVLATCLGLFHKARTGQGQRMRNSLAAAATFLQAAQTVRIGGRCDVPRGGRDHKGRRAEDRYYEVADGWVRVSFPHGQFWSPGLLRECALPVSEQELRSDPAAAVARALAGLCADELCRRLHRAGIPAVRARRITEVMRDERIISAQVLYVRLGDDGRYIVTPGRLASFSRTQRYGLLWFAGIGEHTDEILAHAGLSPEEIQELADGGHIVRGSATPQVLTPLFR